MVCGLKSRKNGVLIWENDEFPDSNDEFPWLFDG
jgi:hypothetical protein